MQLPVGGMHLEQHVSISEFSSTLGLVPDISRAASDVRLVSAGTAVAVSDGAHHLRVGIGYEDYAIRYDFERQALGTQLLDLAYTPKVWSAYVDEQWHPFGWLVLRPGMRLEHVANRADFTGVSPRLGIKAFLGDDLALTASAGRYYQVIHSVRDFGQPVTLFDFWIGADDLTPVAQSDHFVFGFERWLGGDVSLTVEGYYKTFDNLVMQNVRDDPQVRGDEFVPAHGDAHGVDVMVRKYRGRITGWMSYGYGKTIRHTEEQSSFPPSHDRRHTVNVVLQAPGPFGSTMGARWGYGSPLPYTGIVGQWIHREYNVDEHTFDDIDEESISTTINDRRFPYYSRLDVGFRWRFEKWGGILRPYIQLVNVYDRRNVWFYIFEYDRSPPVRRGYSQLPIFPTFGVEFEW
jgi:outer membrane receptor protein involved in Fe transport